MTQGRSRAIVERIAANPGAATFHLATPRDAILSPLQDADEPALASFLAGLSDRSRQFYSVGDTVADAQMRCWAIARYDKLRLVLRAEGAIVGISEFSFDLVSDDIERFANYGIRLHRGRDCRWGLCVADAWHRRGVGTAVAAASFDLARLLGQERIILWGGVQVANEGATSYYRRNGFIDVGRFVNDHDIESIDMLRQLSRTREI